MFFSAKVEHAAVAGIVSGLTLWGVYSYQFPQAFISAAVIAGAEIIASSFRHMIPRFGNHSTRELERGLSTAFVVVLIDYFIIKVSPYDGVIPTFFLFLIIVDLSYIAADGTRGLMPVPSSLNQSQVVSVGGINQGAVPNLY